MVTPKAFNNNNDSSNNNKRFHSLGADSVLDSVLSALHVFNPNNSPMWEEVL